MRVQMKKKLRNGLLIFLFLLLIPQMVWAGDMQVHFLDVGQGLSILVQSEGENLLYDGGGRDASSYVVSYLQNQGVQQLDYMIASHYDADHISGLVGCLSSFPVENLIGPDYVHDSQLYTSFMGKAKQMGLKMQHPSVGDVYQVGSGTFTVLAPQNASDQDSNNSSVVIRLDNGEDSFLFTGDAEHGSEEQMVSAGLDLECTVLQVGHHGSASSTSWDLLQAAVPEYAVVSCGSGNSYGHPDADTMEKLQSMGIQVLRTDKQGTVTAYSTGNGITWDVSPCDDYTPGNPDDTGTMAGDAGVAAYTYTQGATENSQSTDADTQDLGDGNSDQETEAEQQVWISATGSKYHSRPDCGNMNPSKAVEMPVDQAVAQGYEACKKCW